MKQKSFLFLSSLLIAGIIGMTSCKKSESTDVQDDDAKEVVDDSFTEGVFDEVQDIADQAYNYQTSGLKSTTDDFLRFGDCVTITLDTMVMPRVLTVDFGEENCLCRDGKYRRGQIITTFNGRYRQPGTIITHGFNNFYVNDNHIEGNKVIENMGLNDEDKIWYTIHAEGQITMQNTGIVRNWEANRTRTWINGYNTARWVDDVYVIEGTSTFSSSNGRARTREIMRPLRCELSCDHFVSGSVKITSVSRPEMLLDYGNGECDNIATLKIGDRTITIRLH